MGRKNQPAQKPAAFKFVDEAGNPFELPTTDAINDGLVAYYPNRKNGNPLTAHLLNNPIGEYYVYSSYQYWYDEKIRYILRWKPSLGDCFAIEIENTSTYPSSTMFVYGSPVGQSEKRAPDGADAGVLWTVDIEDDK